MNKEKLKRIIKKYDLSRNACNCSDIEPTDTLCNDCVEGLADKIISSGYVHRDDALRCLDTFYVDCDEYGNYQCDPQYNQVIDEIRQALENLGGGE